MFLPGLRSFMSGTMNSCISQCAALAWPLQTCIGSGSGPRSVSAKRCLALIVPVTRARRRADNPFCVVPRGSCAGPTRTITRMPVLIAAESTGQAAITPARPSSYMVREGGKVYCSLRRRGARCGCFLGAMALVRTRSLPFEHPVRERQLPRRAFDPRTGNQSAEHNGWAGLLC